MVTASWKSMVLGVAHRPEVGQEIQNEQNHQNLINIDTPYLDLITSLMIDV